LFAVPQLTRSADIKLNERHSLRRYADGLSLSYRIVAHRPGLPQGKAASDHILMLKGKMRRYSLAATYYVAIILATIGWLWLIAWIAMQLV
jgi:hypothetical protein